MPALRTLVRPWEARQYTVASIFVSRLLSLNACRLDPQGRSCHGHVTSGESSILRSPAHETCGQDGKSHVMHSAPGNDGFELQPCRPYPMPLVDLQACKQHVKVPKSQTCKPQFASEDDRSVPMMRTRTTPGLETFGSAVPQTLKPCVRQNALKRRSQDAVPCACNADDSTFAPASKSKDTKCFEALYSPRPSQIPHISVRSMGKPKVQHAGALESLHQKLSLLESEHVSLCDATILRRSRAFKYTSFEHLAAVLKVLKELLGSSVKAAQALAANPGLLSQPIELLEQKLKVMADFGITEAVVRKLWTCKRRLPLKVESLHKKLSFFKENGLTAEALNRLLNRHPRILGRSSEGSILHIVNFFKSLGMGQKDFMRSMQRYAGHSVDKFQASTKLLKDQGFSESDVHKLISMQPHIRYEVNFETLKSKLDFLLCKQKYDTADIVKWPVCLSYSLQGRIIPRLKVLEEKGLSKVYKLSTILACNELRFQEFGKRKRK